MNRASGFAHALRAFWASFFCQSMQKKPKNLSLAKAPACGGSPRIQSGAGSVLLGPGGGRSTHSAGAPLRHTLPCFRPALRCSVPSRLESRNHRGQIYGADRTGWGLAQSGFSKPNAFFQIRRRRRSREAPDQADLRERVSERSELSDRRLIRASQGTRRASRPGPPRSAFGYFWRAAKSNPPR